MVRFGITIFIGVCLLGWTPLYAGMPSRLHELAQVADGGGDALWMRTSFLIVNQNLYEDAEITLRLYDDGGKALALPINGETKAVHFATVPAKGMVKLATAGKRPAGSNPLGPQVGSATISSNLEVGAQAFFEIYTGKILITQAAIEPMGPMQSVDIFADYDVSTGVTLESPRTGYAIANLSPTEPVQVAIWLYPEDGSDPIWSHVLELPARGHTARYLDEHFPSDKPFRGTARFTGGGSFTVTALQARGLLIGTLPPVQRPLYSRYGGQ
jgi:hypothetical protein